MGFFSSSRKDDRADDRDGAASVAKLLRARFGSKGRHKDQQNTPPRTPPHASASTRGHSARRTPEPRLAPRAPSDGASHRSRPRTVTNEDASLSRATGDVVTTNLAQRLGELAAANAQGLLNDEEYRILRQSLFERFAAGSAVPVEVPLVPLKSSTNLPSSSRAPSVATTSRSPQPHTRAPSLQSKSSIGSLFRRATGRKSADLLDAASVLSGSSTPGLTPRRSLRTPASHASLADEDGRRPSHTSTRRRARTGTEDLGRTASSSPAPSSFRETPPADDDAPALRAALARAEAEARRVQDSFDALELRTLTRRAGDPRHEGSWTVLPAPPRTPERTPTRTGGRSPHGVPLVAQPVALARRPSLASLASRLRERTTRSPAPSPAASPQTSLSPLGRLAVGSRSSVVLPTTPLAPVGEDDDDSELAALERELADVRARRAQVAARYDARLELLRARLKSAELRERLLRK